MVRLVPFVIALATACASPTRAPLPASPAAPPRFSGSIVRIDAAVRARITWSWRPGCPVPLDEMRLLTMSYWGFDGAAHGGEMIVHERWAVAIVGVFRKLFAARFPIEKMVLADTYPQEDTRRVAANVTTGFACRRSVGDPARWSEHSYGRAVDVNPLQNPYVSRRGAVVPSPWGRPYLDRTQQRAGMIHDGDVAVRAFEAIGWTWGGRYTRSKELQEVDLTFE